MKEFEKIYLTVKDIQNITGVSYHKSLVLMNEAIRIMRERNLYVFEDKKNKVALTSVVKELLGLWKHKKRESPTKEFLAYIITQKKKKVKQRL